MPGVAIIGTGYIGKVHLETLKRIPDVEIKAVVDNDLEVARTLATQYGISLVCADYHELLDNPSIQVFHNCTPNNLHFEVNRTLLEKGKHVMSEKPLSITSTEAALLTDLAKNQNLVTGINFCYRYYPVVQEAAARIRKGEIGQVHSVFGSYFQDWLLFDTDYNWRLDKEQSGNSNTMADIGSHWLDLIQFVTNARIVEVMADLRTILPIRKRSLSKTVTFEKQNSNNEKQLEEVPIELDDYGSVLVHFDNGSAGTFSVCQLCAGRKCTIDVQIYGTQSSLAWNHETSTQLWSGHRDAPNQILFENPLLQNESTSRFARLPSGHPLGYYDAVYNLFREFYNGLTKNSY